MTMQKALLSHAKSIRWLLASLRNKGAKPGIYGVRVNDDEVTVVLVRSGVLHNPSFATLRGYKPLGRPKKDWKPLAKHLGLTSPPESSAEAAT